MVVKEIKDGFEVGVMPVSYPFFFLRRMRGVRLPLCVRREELG